MSTENTETVISINHVSKVYKLFEKPMDRLKESLSLTHKNYHTDHFALEDISLEVHKGECVGIIGTNGSGKSTLLKIVTGVLNPTSGNVELKGRVSAILELGAGFNMEYTGIENIFLNGTMLGYTEEEMKAKLDDIIAFAEIGDFINQPVKTYSSGMFARLAFAVAINVDPDILIVDEALSVGDIFFQSKCYRKFNDLKEAGKTILFVSHDMGSVIKYCERCLLINKGKQVMVGKSSEAVDVYKKILANQYDDETKEEEETEESAEQTEERTEADASGAVSAEKPKKGLWRERLIANAQLVEYGDKAAEIVDFAIIDHKGMIPSSVDKNQRFRIKMKIKFHETMEHPIFAFSIKDRKGTEITGTNTALEDYTKDVVEAGKTVKVEGKDINLLELIAADPAFNLTLEELEKTSEAAEAAWKESQRVLEQWQEIWRIDQKVCQALKPQMEERSEVMHQYEKINGLYQLLSGNRKNSRMDIETYVQRHYLEQILEAANQRFQDMSAGQFELRMCDIDKAGTGKNRGLDLMVYSAVTGKVREVRTLSGGESFMAALSLALGMADQIQESSAAINLDMMFIDEGFGSLDEHSRDQAVKVLQNMAEGEKLIGIISHVTELKQEIEDQLIVTKDDQGSHTRWQIS